jgi:hypothetical protein
LLLGFHLDGHPHLFFELFAEFLERLEAPVIADPDEEFAIRPGTGANNREEYENDQKEIPAHKMGFCNLRRFAGSEIEESLAIERR